MNPVPASGLAALADVVLMPDNQRLLDEAGQQAGGSALWRARKTAEARDLLALSQIAPRLFVQHLDLREALRALLLLRVPVPCRPGANGEFIVAQQATLGLIYPHEALRQQLPGYAFLQILAPLGVWHANVSFPEHGQALCLGAQLPAGIRVKELVLMAYGALSMQTVQIDEADSAGVLNVVAAHWWQQNLGRIPLSRTPFLGTDDLTELKE